MEIPKDGFFIEDFVLVSDIISKGSIDGKNPIESLDHKRSHSYIEKDLVTYDYRIRYKTSLGDFLEKNATKIVEELRKPKPTFYYSLRLICDFPFEKPTEALVESLMLRSFRDTEFEKSFLRSNTHANTTVTLDKFTLVEDVLIANGLVKCEVKDRILSCNDASQIFERVVAKGGENFSFGDPGFMNYAWNEFPPIDMWEFLDAAMQIPDIKFKFHDSRVVFKAKQIDPKSFLEVAAMKMFPNGGEGHSIEIGQLFQSYFKLTKAKLPRGMSSECFEIGDRDLRNWSDGFVKINFKEDYDDGEIEGELKQGLKDLETMTKCLKIMLDECQKGKKACNGSFIAYVREKFKNEILSDPLKYSKGRYDGQYCDEIKAAAKCILGTIEDEDEED